MSMDTQTATKPPRSATFLDKGDDMAVARKIYIKVLFGGTFMICLSIFAFFSIFWGAYWKTPVGPLDGWIIDLDQSTIGSTVTQAFLQSSTSGGRINWKQRDPSEFPGGLDQIAERVREEDTWTAVVIHQGATDALNSAIESVDSSYNGSNAVTAYGIEARNENGYRSFIAPTVQQVMLATAQRFAAQNAAQFASSSSSSLSSILSTAPQLITAPLSFQLVNLAPYDIPVATAITFVGLIYLLILAFFVVTISMSAREVSGLEHRLTTRSLIRLRITSAFIAYFFCSFMYSLLSLAFQVDFSRKFGRGGFVLFWMLSFVGMLSVGLVLDAMVTLLTMRGIPFFMIFFIIINVSVCAMPIPVLPSVFRYGYAMPFYNVSRAVRTILFATKNDVGLNFGVLIAYVVVTACFTLPLAVWWRRRLETRNTDDDETGGAFREAKDVEAENGEGTREKN